MGNYLKNIVQLLSPEARKSLDSAIAMAVARTHHEVDIEHLLLVVVSQQTDMMQELCLACGLQGDRLLNALQHSLDRHRSGNTRGPVLSASLINFIESGWMHASVNWQQTTISNMALLASLLDESTAQHHPLPAAVQDALSCDVAAAQSLLCNHAQSESQRGKTGTEMSHDSNSALARYTHNLTEQVRSSGLDPVLGRESEIRQMIDILLRRRQNNPVLTGEPGVGKTALAEGLAQRIVGGGVPDVLKNTELFALDMGLLQAGASVKGEFENRLQTLLKEIKQYPRPVILFIDEAHTLIGAGGTAGQNDAANLLKPALARGEVRVVAATTWAEYKKYFEKDAALARRFQVVKVNEPDEEMATNMLRATAPLMARHHQVRIMESALSAAVQLSSRYIAGRQLPDKSVSLLDTACARVATSQSYPPKEIEDIRAMLSNLRVERESLIAEGEHSERLALIGERETALAHDLAVLEPCWHHQRQLVEQIRQCDDQLLLVKLRCELKEAHQQHALVFDCVDDVCVADVLAGWTGIPLGRMLEKNSEQAGELFTRLQKRVIGQDHALHALARQIRIAQAGINDPEKPTGIFMLAGPSGVGKTETALALAELMYGGERGLITINMSEYQEAHTVSALKGAPPGYVGYGQGGVLTEAVRRKPYSVVLLDEVEKAHPDVMELFYQVFDKGGMEDAEGQHINFRNTLIILTSNLASEKLMDADAQDISALCSLIRPDFDRVFRPALMGRMQLIPYLPLNNKSLQKIIRLKLNKLCSRVVSTSGGNACEFHAKAIALIADQCKVAQSGARDIDSVINRMVMPVLAEVLLSMNKEMTKTIMLSVSKGQIVQVKKTLKDRL